ncbi:class I SAM-dependent methyltransferase [Frankia sp. AgKG'84/4]|uniref:class I SAM-dependent methyltransferase n=1 Tax=Frankia sp. AgKG'84/4 TaxID=573490 RepID=UPI00200C3AFB|nr:class I SAM-dependent methyltransferase [Frankia sp. AgKG'84/4]MCL9793335.1 class I SAM-dependent methyltransferase [Frankia sp. AgKG'84/4]
MPTEDATSAAVREAQPHQARHIAESFGSNPERYDRVRPRYPDAMVRRIAAAVPGPDLLAVGCGTGIDARQFQAAGCRLLGIDPDPRMAAFARRGGLDVEVATFEDWDSAGRTFDGVVAGQSWHWIDPVAGAAKAAGVLRPGGRLAVYWNVFDPAPDLAERFRAVHERELPDLPRNPWARSAISAYQGVIDQVAGGIRDRGGFGEPDQWRFDWTCEYTRDEWLEQMSTSGDANVLPRERLARLLAGLGAVIDERGGRFTMGYAAIVLTARAVGAPR